MSMLAIIWGMLLVLTPSALFLVWVLWQEGKLPPHDQLELPYRFESTAFVLDVGSEQSRTAADGGALNRPSTEGLKCNWRSGQKPPRRCCHSRSALPDLRDLESVRRLPFSSKSSAALTARQLRINQS